MSCSRLASFPRRAHAQPQAQACAHSSSGRTACCRQWLRANWQSAHWAVCFCCLSYALAPSRWHSLVLPNSTDRRRTRKVICALERQQQQQQQQQLQLLLLLLLPLKLAARQMQLLLLLLRASLQIKKSKIFLT